MRILNGSKAAFARIAAPRGSGSLEILRTVTQINVKKPEIEIDKGIALDL